NPGVVERAVEPAKGGERVLHHRLHVLGAGHVAGQRDRLTALFVDLRHRVLGRGGVKIGGGDLCPLAHHRQRRGAADPAATPGHQRDLAVEYPGHASLPRHPDARIARRRVRGHNGGRALPKDDAMPEDWKKLSDDVERLLKLRSFVFAMKLYERGEEMEAIPRIRRPQSIHTLDQIVGQASRLGWTVGITSDNLVGAQCRAVVGLGNAKDAAWRSGKHMAGVWYSSEEDASAHQAAMECVPDGQFEALAISPLASGRLDPPDIALFYATPG